MITFLAAALTFANPVWKPLGEPGSGGWVTSLSMSPYDPKRVLIGGDMLGVGLSLDRGESWGATSGFRSWEIAEFTWHPTDPKTVWVGTMSGPYKSEDGGQTWQEKRKGFPEASSGFYSAPIQVVLFDPTDAKRLLAFGGSHREWSSPGNPQWGAVWESKDEGNSWSKLSDLKSGAGAGLNIVAARYSGKSIFVAALGEGVHASEDGGKTWEARNGGLPHLRVKGLVANSKNPRQLWASLDCLPKGDDVLSGGVFRTLDGGLSWVPAQKGLRISNGKDGNLTPRYPALAISASDPNRLLTSDTAWDNGVIYITKDGGTSWQLSAKRTDITMPLPAGLGQTVFTFDPVNANVAFAAGSEHVIRTTDGGALWSDVASRPGGNGWRGRGFTGWVSTNFKFNPLVRDSAYFLGMDAANFWQTKDGRQSWTRGRTGLPDWGGARDVVFAGPQTLFVTLGQGGNFDGIGRSTNGGVDWTVLAGDAHGLPPLGSANSAAIGLFVLPSSPNVVFATIGGKLYRTTNAGETWTKIHDGPGLSWIAGVPNQARRFFVAGQQGLYRSDNGSDLNLVEDGPNDLSRIAVDAMPTVYVTSWRSQGGLWRWQAGKWTKLLQDRMIGTVAVDPTNRNRIAVATDDHPYKDIADVSGVWVSTDAGATWKQLNEGLPMLRGNVLAFNPWKPGELVFGTGGRGFWVIQL
ncbi:MAG: hypothetical protein ACOYON_07810 [Fimbriimonas sp.]